MKGLCATLLLVPLIAFVGCENKSPPGGPGATGHRASTHLTSQAGTHTTTTSKTEVGKSDDTFQLKGPILATGLKQGEKKEVDISITRGKDFQQDVMLKFHAPKGLKVEPASADLKPSDNDVKVMVEADKDAPLGDQNIEVTGTPAKGDATNLMLKVTVKK
jgi:uncharacterized membrane protein